MPHNHLILSQTLIHPIQPFPALGSFQMSQLFTSGGQSIGVSASASVLPMNIQDWFPLEWTGWISLQYKGLSRVFSIHVSMSFSQIIPPSPSPTESKRLFYTSVSLLLSLIQGYHYHLSIFHIYALVYCWCFSFWLTSLCIIGSSFIHLIRTDSNVFFLMAE